MSSSTVDATESISPPEVYKVFSKVGEPRLPSLKLTCNISIFPVEVLGLRAGDSSTNSSCTLLFFFSFLLLTFQTLSGCPPLHSPPIIFPSCMNYSLIYIYIFLALSQTVTSKPSSSLMDSVCECVCVNCS